MTYIYIDVIVIQTKCQSILNFVMLCYVKNWNTEVMIMLDIGLWKTITTHSHTVPDTRCQLQERKVSMDMLILN